MYRSVNLKLLVENTTNLNYNLKSHAFHLHSTPLPDHPALIFQNDDTWNCAGHWSISGNRSRHRLPSFSGWIHSSHQRSPIKKSQLEEVQAHITQQGGKALTYLADVSVEKEVNQMIESVVEQTGGLDVVRVSYHDVLSILSHPYLNWKSLDGRQCRNMYSFSKFP